MQIAPKLPSSDKFEELVAAPVATSSEAMAAAGELAKESSLTASSTFVLGKSYYDATQETPKVPAKELQAKYPEYANIFNQDEHQAMAEAMIEREAKRRELEAKVEAGPKGFWQATKEFGAGMGAMLSDPMEATINVGGMLLTGGMSALAQMGAKGLGRVGLQAAGEAVVRGVGKSTIAEGATALGARAGLGAGVSQFGLSMAENAVITGASVGSDMAATNMGGREFTAGEALQHIGTNVAIGAGLHGLVHGLGKLTSPKIEKVAAKVGPDGAEVVPARTKVVFEQNSPIDAKLGALPDNVAEGVLVNSEKAIAEGRVVDHSVEINQLRRETFNDGGGQYKYDPAKDVRRAPLYGATEVSVDNIHDAPSVPPGDFLGDDIIQLTDNPHAAESLAARGNGEVPGSHFTVELDPSTKLFDLGDEDSLAEGIRARIEEARSGGKFEGDLYGDVHVLNEIRDELKAAGYDGIKHSGGKFLSEEALNQHTVAIWNKDKIIQKSAQSGDHSLSVTPPSDELRAKYEAENSHKSRIDYNEEGVKKLDQVEAEGPSKNDTASAKAALQEVEQDYKAAIERQEITEAEVKALNDELAIEREKLKQTQKAWRQLVSCKVGK